MPSSPFSSRGVVWKSEFFDREENLDELADLIKKPTAQSMCIIAPERMGVTSLLRKFCDEIGPQTNSECGYNYRFEYIDISTLQTKSQVYAALIKALKSQGDTPDDLNRASAKQTRRTYIVLDEFEYLSNIPGIDASFYEQLRSIAQNRAPLIVAAKHSLKDLALPSSGKTSAFYNIFTNMRLEHWNDDTCRRFLIEKSQAVNAPFSKAETDFIIENTRQTTPFHLQVLANCYFRAKSSGKPINRKAVLKAYQEEISKPKGRPRSWPKIPKDVVIVAFLSIISLIVVIAWAVYGVATSNVLFNCTDASQAIVYELTLEHPQYLAYGDVGLLSVTLHNTGQATDSPAVIVDFEPQVQIDEASKSRLVFEFITPGDRLAKTIRFRRAFENTITINVGVQNDNQILVCSEANPTRQAQVKFGYLPYLTSTGKYFGLGTPLVFLWLMLKPPLKSMLKKFGVEF